MVIFLFWTLCFPCFCHWWCAWNLRNHIRRSGSSHDFQVLLHVLEEAGVAFFPLFFGSKMQHWAVKEEHGMVLFLFTQLLHTNSHNFSGLISVRFSGLRQLMSNVIPHLRYRGLLFGNYYGWAIRQLVVLGKSSPLLRKGVGCAVAESSSCMKTKQPCWWFQGGVTVPSTTWHNATPVPWPGTGDFQSFGSDSIFSKVVEEVTNFTSLKLNEVILDLYVRGFEKSSKLHVLWNVVNFWAVQSMLNFRAIDVKIEELTWFGAFTFPTLERGNCEPLCVCVFFF